MDDGRVTSLAWLGFKEETPHQGIQSTTEQSAMTPAPGAEASGVPPAPAVAAPTLSQPSPPMISSQQVHEAAQALALIGARLADTIKTMSEPTPQSTAQPVAAVPPSPGPRSGNGGESGAPGLSADKESIATSVKNAPTVRLGQVAAANGLDIQTKSPKWSVTTLQTRRPANPTIRITFGRDGRVVRAAFVGDGRVTYGTGSSDVDEPLLSAVYSWTARGKRLAELTSQDPEGEVTILITVILTG